jgi:hypothetical protein
VDRLPSAYVVDEFEIEIDYSDFAGRTGGQQWQKCYTGLMRHAIIARLQPGTDYFFRARASYSNKIEKITDLGMLMKFCIQSPIVLYIFVGKQCSVDDAV